MKLPGCRTSTGPVLANPAPRTSISTLRPCRSGLADDIPWLPTNTAMSALASAFKMTCLILQFPYEPSCSNVCTKAWRQDPTNKPFIGCEPVQIVDSHHTSRSDHTVIRADIISPARTGRPGRRGPPSRHVSCNRSTAPPPFLRGNGATGCVRHLRRQKLAHHGCGISNIHRPSLATIRSA